LAQTTERIKGNSPQIKLMNLDSIKSKLVKQATRIELHHLVRTTSTNEILKQNWLAGDRSPVLLIADEQTQGRGRRDHQWHAPAGLDLMFSLRWQPQLPFNQWPRLTTLAAVALTEAINEVTGQQAWIKWPNDLYLNEKKIAGLLAEATSLANDSAFILGIGLNINNTSFPENLQSIATSLRLESSSDDWISREALLTSFLNHFFLRLERCGTHFHEIISEAEKKQWLLNKPISATLNQKKVHGQMIGLSTEGYLILKTDSDELLELNSVEAVHIRPQI
jgi:BirA family transcriptional regulator, biotin operon repressor / biotin---[acetyl-CoA-carboxylase] ligase